VADALQNFIDGKWNDATEGAFDVFNPATGDVIATAPHSKPEVDAAVAVARRAFDEGRGGREWPASGTDPPRRRVSGGNRSACAIESSTRKPIATP
jgi:hypothetical protein